MKLLYWVDAAFYLSFSSFVVYETPVSAGFLIGISIAIPGFILWMVARFQLGQSFSVRARAKALVTTGLYSKIRHPIYVFAGFAFAGMFIAWGKTLLLLGFLVFYSSQILRVLKEEKVLEEAFGDEWRHYKARTWF